MCKEIMLFIGKNQSEDEVLISYTTRSFKERISIQVCGVVSPFVSEL